MYHQYPGQQQQQLCTSIQFAPPMLYEHSCTASGSVNSSDGRAITYPFFMQSFQESLRRHQCQALHITLYKICKFGNTAQSVPIQITPENFCLVKHNDILYYHLHELVSNYNERKQLSMAIHDRQQLTHNMSNTNSINDNTNSSNNNNNSNYNGSNPNSISSQNILSASYGSVTTTPDWNNMNNMNNNNNNNNNNRNNNSSSSNISSIGRRCQVTQTAETSRMSIEIITFCYFLRFYMLLLVVRICYCFLMSYFWLLYLLFLFLA